MPIQKQQIPIQFNGGLDTKSDQKAVPVGSLLELKNAQFTNTGALNKRFGYDILSQNIEGGGTITSADAISAFNEELCLFGSDTIYSTVPATGNWLNRGTAVSVIVHNKQIVRNGAQQLNPDCTVHNGIETYVWEDSGGGVRYSVLDNQTKAFCVADALCYEFGVKPKVIQFNNIFYIFFSDGTNNISYRTINPKNPTRITNQVSFITDGYGDFAYDVAVVGSCMFIAYIATADVLRVVRLDSTLHQTTVDVKTGGFDGYGSFCVNVAGDSQNNIWVSWGDGSGVWTSVYSNTLVPQLANTLVDMQTIDTITGIESSPGVLSLLYEINDAVSYNHRIKTADITIGGSVATGDVIRSVGLASKAFMANGSLYCNVAFDSPLQATYFTIKLGTDPIAIIAKVAAQVGGGLRTNHMLPETSETAAGIHWANLIKGKTISEANVLFSLLGVNSTVLDFENSNRFLSVVQSNNLLFVGGILSSYDGVSVVEQNFHVYPEGSQVVLSSGGGLSTGQYQYVVIYSWRDNLGQVQYSEDSDPITVNATAGQKATITGPMCRLTAKQTTRSNVNVEIYRTQADATDFHLVTSSIAPVLNDTSVDTFTFVDLASDVDIAANATPYTFGGILPNQAPPACSLISLYQNRVMLSGMEDPNLIWFSKNRFENDNFNTIPVEFSPFLTIGVDPRGGAITALGLLDSNLVIFKERAIFILTGDGPTDSGGGDSFPDPALITSDVGCKDPNSVQTTPQGLVFQTDKGLYLLDRSLSVSYFGAPVEADNDKQITSCTLNNLANQIIFTTIDSDAIVFDYYRNQWGHWTNHQAVDSDIFNGSFCFVKSNGQVYVQNPDKFTDGTRAIEMSLTTPNLNFAQLCGAQRVFRCILLGDNRGPHRLLIEVARDFSKVYTESVTIDASSAIDTWGGDGYWGKAPGQDGYGSDVWGGEYIPYEHRIDFKVQRSTSYRLRITEIQIEGSLGEGLALSAMVFEVGTLGGPDRIRAKKIVGTK